MSQLNPAVTASVMPVVTPAMRGTVTEVAVVPPAAEDTREVAAAEAAPLPVSSLRAWIIALAVASSVVALDLDVPVLRPAAALFTLLAAPSYLIFHKFDLPSSSTVAKGVYAFGLALLGVLVVGLGLNAALPAAGVDRPLQPLVLAITWFVLDVALVAWRPRRLPTGALATVGRHVTQSRLEPAQTLASVALVLAVAGAIRLNNGAGGTIALLAHVLAVAAVLALLLREGTPGRDARALSLVALSLLLSTSLRGWTITGHDIQAEYFAFSLTNGNQHWSMDLLVNAYNACLSVTVLPTVLVQATGLDGVFVFKVLLQLVFALVPVLTFVFARRLLSRRLALVAAVLVIAFPTFYTDMPYLVRQEIAFFFLALMLVAATEPGGSRFARLGSLPKVALTALFGLGVVLSHYSTTYLLLLGLVVGLALWAIVTLVRRRRAGHDDQRTRSLVLLSPLLVALLGLGSWAWAGPVTGTGGHALEVAQAAITGLFEDDGPASSDVSFFLLSPDDTTPRERLNMFVDETMDARKQAEPGQMVVEEPGRAELRPKILRPSELPLTSAGKALDSVGLDPSTVNAALRIGAALVFQALLLLGLVQLLRLRRTAAPPDKETGTTVEATPPDKETGTTVEATPPDKETGTTVEATPPDNETGTTVEATPPDNETGTTVDEPTGFTRELACVTFGAVAVLGLVVLIPTLSVEYGVLRAFQQTMLVVAPVVAAGLGWVATRLRAPTALVVAVPVILLLVLSGTLPSLLGGNPPRLAMANTGLYHDRYLAADSDLESVRWLENRKADARRPEPTVIATRNYGLRMVSQGLSPDEAVDWMYPTILTRGSYVLVDAQLAKKHRGTVFYSGDLITYAYPQQDLDRNLDLVYSAGRSRVYR